eukprot:4576798-Prymnesium_polylepis.1
MDPERRACLTDELRHGVWRPLETPRPHRPCATHEFANSTCGPAFSVSSFCAALRCRALLVVGDSVMNLAFHALNPEFRPTTAVGSRVCHVGPLQVSHSRSHSARPTFNPCPAHRLDSCLCTIPIRSTPSARPRPVAAARSDNKLDAAWEKIAGESAVQNCPLHPWLARHSQGLPSDLDYGVLVVGSGIHLDDYRDVHGEDLRHDGAWHQAKATQYFRALRPFLNRTQIVWVKQHWGVINFSANPAPVRP